MPRPRRHVPREYVYHVLNRGCARRVIFSNPEQFADFIRLLEIAAARFGVRIIAYCLMPNHWHLLLWPTRDGAISAFIHWLCTCQASRLAAERGLGAGHLYQGRFRSFVVEQADYYYRVVAYVEANPVRASLVGCAENWRWSSAIARVPGADVSFIAPGPLALPEDWLAVVNAGISQVDLEELRTCSAVGRPYGSPSWTRRTASDLGLEQTLRQGGRPKRSSDSMPACGSCPLPVREAAHSLTPQALSAH